MQSNNVVQARVYWNALLYCSCVSHYTATIGNKAKTEKIKNYIYTIKKESTRNASNKGTRTLHRVYLHCVANFCATVLNISKEIISNNNWSRKQLWRSFEVWWRNLPLARFIWTMKFLSSCSSGILFLVLFQAIILSLAFRKCKKDFLIRNIILVKDICQIKTEIARFPIGMRLESTLYTSPWSCWSNMIACHYLHPAFIKRNLTAFLWKQINNGDIVMLFTSC